jgi:protein-tyrosine sulfotransferase
MSPELKDQGKSVSPRVREQVFVLSLPRTGSTLMRLILDTHPEVCCPGELRLGQLCEDLYRALYFSVGQASAGDETARAALSSARAREIVGGFMGAYAAAKGKSIWAEKTPANVEHVGRLYDTFPDAAYICLHRNLLDVLRSGWEMTKYGKLRYELWDYGSFLDYCLGQTRALLEFERVHCDQTIRVHYENLVLNPAEELPRLFSFLGVGWEPSLVEAVFSTKHDPGPGDPKAEFTKSLHTSSIGRGASAEVLAEVRRAPRHLQRALDELLLELGYQDAETALRAAARVEEQTGGQLAHAGQDFNDVNELFTRHFRAKLEEARRESADLKGAVKFVVRGAGGGTWIIDLDSQPPSIEAGDRDADCTVTIRADDLLRLATGELNVGECYLQAKLRVLGNDALAISLGHTLFA